MHALSANASFLDTQFGGLLAELASSGAWSESLKLLTLANGAASIPTSSTYDRSIAAVAGNRAHRPTLVYAPDILITDAKELAERLAAWESLVVDNTEAVIRAPVKSWLQSRRDARRARAEQRDLERAIRVNGHAWLAEAADGGKAG